MKVAPLRDSDCGLPDAALSPYANSVVTVAFGEIAASEPAVITAVIVKEVVIAPRTFWPFTKNTPQIPNLPIKKISILVIPRLPGNASTVRTRFGVISTYRL